MPQAFKQAPWRLQILSTGRTALWIVGLVILGGVYLAVNAKVAEAGRELLMLQQQHELLIRTNGELSAAYAELISPEIMMERAAYLGFRPALPDEINYLIVDGFEISDEFEAPRPLTSGESRPGMLSPSYTETLGEWLSRFAIGGDR
ncbi:MAG: hypothetical protein J4N76_04675 [Chloroflexi bacterium]|nr:hypothetical protein [Chloroflexota bacterium]MDK1044905.1 hypothetical protein [Anaerolineales bacterium]MCH8093973.1 hypothetical protein [Chloroflexota bacterium]MCH8338200.1 hypothetical protein [Chloroflexota bacterium]MCH8875751.1 hypothetical protein [Chloroflexota bacterium]